MNGPGASNIRAATTAEVTFKLSIVNVGNVSNPVSVMIKTVPVVSGTASAVFTGVPASTCVGEINIVGGNINSYTSFQGALDLKKGEQNTLEVAPVGSKMKQDFVAHVIKQVVASPVLFGKALPNLAAQVSGAISTLDTQKTTAYDDAVNLFANFVSVEVVIPTGGVEVPYLVGKTKTEAEAILASLGLTVSVVSTYDPSVAAGIVIKQTPVVWTKLTAGSVVAIEVSSGTASSETLSATPFLGGSYWQGQTIKLAVNLPSGSDPVAKVEFFDGAYGFTDTNPPYEFTVENISGQKTYKAVVTFSSGAVQTFSKTIACRPIVDKVEVFLANGSVSTLYPDSTIPSVDSVPGNVATFVITLAAEIDVKPNTFSITATSVNTGAKLNLAAESERIKITHSAKNLTVSVSSSGGTLATLNPGRTYKVQFNSGLVTIAGTQMEVKSVPIYQFKVADSSYFIFDSTTGSINGYVFSATSLNKNLVIPDSINGKTVTRIADWAFSNVGLTSVSFPSTLTSIGAYAFSGNQLTSIDIPGTVVVIGAEAFRYNALTNIKIGAGVTVGDRLLTSTQNFRDAYLSGGAGTYVGTQTGVWTKQ